jgi:hypothetical protein
MTGPTLTHAPAKLISDPPPRKILDPAQIDHVAEAVIGLARELWVLSDRFTIMEKVMSAHGVDLAAEIDAYTPDEAVQAELDVKRKRLMGTILAALRADI